MTHILIPRTPTLDLLRPFFECPTSELDQAWAAMVRIAEVQHARAGSQCLAQIEEPAQPIAGYRISDPSDPTIKPWLSDTPDDNGYTSEPLYAGAAPAAVSPQGVAAWMTPEGDRVVTAETMDGARKDGGASLSSLRPYTVALVRAGEPAAAAPALEAPAAPCIIDIGEGGQLHRATPDSQNWALHQGHAHIRYLNKFERNFVNSAIRAALAAAPQAPSQDAPAGPVQHQGMTIAGNGAAELGKLMREQRDSRLGVYPDGNPNSGQP